MHRFVPSRFAAIAMVLATGACGQAVENDRSMWEPFRGTDPPPAPDPGGAAGVGGDPGGAAGVGGNPGGGAGVGGSAGGGAGVGGGSGVGGGGGAAGVGGAGGGAGGPASGGSGCLTFQVTIVDYNGNYSPENVGAIWITDAGGAFKHSLNVWGSKRIGNIPAWNGASGGNKVDAITSATKPTTGQRTGTWNCADPAEVKVPDGEYVVWVEYTQDNFIFFNPPAFVKVPFTKGTAPVSLTPPDVPGRYTQMQLTYTP